jgi:Domain of unknown function DUF29
MGHNSELYEQDFFQWTQTTAALIRQGKWHEVDSENVAEELEGLGKRDRRELASRLQVLMMRLLKWHYQSERRLEGHSWRSTIRTQRLQLRLLLRDSPSLRPQVPTFVADVYPVARTEASDETGLPETTFPQECPWVAEQILDDDFWPTGIITQA